MPEPQAAEQQEDVERDSLGTFGTPLAEEDAVALDVDLDFQWYGRVIRVHPLASVLDLMEFLAEAGEYDDNSPALLGPLQRLLKTYVHPDDWARFWHLARVNHATPREAFMPLVRAITSYVTERPTERPRASSGGRSSTGESSTHGLSLQDQTVIAGPLAGRPDLGGVVLMRAEHDQAQQQA